MKRTLKFAKLFKAAAVVFVGDKIDEDIIKSRREQIKEIPNSPLYKKHIKYEKVINVYKNDEIKSVKFTMYCLNGIFIGLAMIFFPIGLVLIIPISACMEILSNIDIYTKYRSMPDIDFMFKFESEKNKLKLKQ